MALHPVDIYVGKRLRERRIMLGMSQEAVGKAIGVSFQQIQKYEKGVNRMGSSRIYDFSKILNVSVAYFFDDYEKPVEAMSEYSRGMAEDDSNFEHDRISSRETLELVRAYYSISDEKLRRKFYDLLKSMADNDKPPAA